jgi:hypothetical protein
MLLCFFEVWPHAAFKLHELPVCPAVSPVICIAGALKAAVGSQIDKPHRMAAVD